MGLTQIDLIKQILLFPLRVPRFLRETINPLADAADAAERYMGLTQIDLIKQIYYFLLRFHRETINPLADCADCAERYMGLTQIDLIIQIYYFLCGFCDFCEKLLFLSQIAQMPQKGAERGIVKRDAMSCEACDARRTTARAVATSIPSR